jgi:erythromycin esterase-like protein
MNCNYRMKRKKQWLSENITVLKQFLHFQFKSFTKSDHRYQYMAENVIWLNHYYTDSMIIFSAHNGYIGTPNNCYKIMGDYLKKVFGDRCTTFGLRFIKEHFQQMVNKELELMLYKKLQKIH